MELLDYLVNLAPAGETALIVRQTPRHSGGEIKYHADGAPVATFPAFLPTHKRKDGEAWYINTGSFVIDRLTAGKPSAKSENITQATAADILRNALRQLPDVVLHVHDEILLEVDTCMAEQAKEQLADVMCTAPAWADGLPLAAETSVMSRYGKG